MTRDERLAAGWVERWGWYDWRDGTWQAKDTGWTTKPDKRLAASSFQVALRQSRSPSYAAEARILPRRFWTRKRTKPELKVGDEVLVRATVLRSVDDDGDMRVRMRLHGGTDEDSWVRQEDIVR